MLLLIDQDVNKRIIAETLLQCRGWRVQWAQGRWQSLELMENSRTDLVTQDLTLSDPDDFEVLRRTTSAVGAAPILIVSDRDDTEVDHLTADLPGVSILGQRRDPLAIAQFIEEALSRSGRRAQASHRS